MSLALVDEDLAARSNEEVRAVGPGELDSPPAREQEEGENRVVSPTFEGRAVHGGQDAAGFFHGQGAALVRLAVSADRIDPEGGVPVDDAFPLKHAEEAPNGREVERPGSGPDALLGERALERDDRIRARGESGPACPSGEPPEAQAVVSSRRCGSGEVLEEPRRPLLDQDREGVARREGTRCDGRGGR